jgi:hypothetical protein
MKFKETLKKKSKTVAIDLNTIYNTELKNADPEAFTALTYEDAKSLMARSRSSVFPKGIHTAEEIGRYLEANMNNPTCHFAKNYFKTVSVTVEGKKEYAVIIRNEKVLEEVNSHVTSYLFDATFKTCPRHFYQAFNVAADIEGHTTLLFCAVMTRKTYPLYLKLLRAIRASYPQVNPLQGTSDYESGMAKAVYNVWPGCELNGCMLHFMCALNKKMRAPGKKFFGLALVEVRINLTLT